MKLFKMQIVTNLVIKNGTNLAILHSGNIIMVSNNANRNGGAIHAKDYNQEPADADHRRCDHFHSGRYAYSMKDTYSLQASANVGFRCALSTAAKR